MNKDEILTELSKLKKTYEKGIVMRDFSAHMPKTVKRVERHRYTHRDDRQHVEQKRRIRGLLKSWR